MGEVLATVSGEVVEADLPCAGCGYNLRTLRAEGTCPECGQSVGRSLEEFRVGSVVNFRRVAWGAAWVGAGVLGTNILQWIQVLLGSRSPFHADLSTWILDAGVRLFYCVAILEGVLSLARARRRRGRGAKITSAVALGCSALFALIACVLLWYRALGSARGKVAWWPPFMEISGLFAEGAWVYLLVAGVLFIFALVPCRRRWAAATLAAFCTLPMLFILGWECVRWGIGILARLGVSTPVFTQVANSLSDFQIAWPWFVEWGAGPLVLLWWGVAVVAWCAHRRGREITREQT